LTPATLLQPATPLTPAAGVPQINVEAARGAAANLVRLTPAVASNPSGRTAAAERMPIAVPAEPRAPQEREPTLEPSRRGPEWVPTREQTRRDPAQPLAFPVPRSGPVTPTPIRSRQPRIQIGTIDVTVLPAPAPAPAAPPPPARAAAPSAPLSRGTLHSYGLAQR
jgi:hypothetical protein